MRSSHVYHSVRGLHRPFLDHDDDDDDAHDDDDDREIVLELLLQLVLLLLVVELWEVAVMVATRSFLTTTAICICFAVRCPRPHVVDVRVE